MSNHVPSDLISIRNNMPDYNPKVPTWRALTELDLRLYSLNQQLSFFQDLKVPFLLNSKPVQLFYYFVKSEGNPKQDPLILWLTGGPGCSAFSGLVYEIDAPVSTGFSYATTSRASQSADLQQCDQAYEFLRKWLIDHSEFISNPVYIGGDSYSAITVPIVAQLISNGNKADINQFINLQGYILGNAATFPEEDNYAIPFAYGMGLISDELYHSLMRSCGGEYRNINPNNVQCLKDVDAFEQCKNGLETSHILEPECGFASPKPPKFFGERRALLQRFIKLQDYDPSSSSSAFSCRVSVRIPCWKVYLGIQLD
ncbi:hypothetical protein LguiA_004012 [Lonicera macranthoides]